MPVGTNEKVFEDPQGDNDNLSEQIRGVKVKSKIMQTEGRNGNCTS